MTACSIGSGVTLVCPNPINPHPDDTFGTKRQVLALNEFLVEHCGRLAGGTGAVIDGGEGMA